MTGVIQPFDDHVGMMKPRYGGGQRPSQKETELSPECTRPAAPFCQTSYSPGKRSLLVRHLGWELLLLADKGSAMDTLSTFTYFPTENLMFQSFNG